QGGKCCRDLSLVEGVANRAALRMTRVQLGDDDELDGARVRKGPAAPAQDRDRIAAGGETSRLLIEDGFDAADDGRTRVVQESHALAPGRRPTRLALQCPGSV